MQERKQWSAAKVGVTSVFKASRCHKHESVDMKHDAAKQAANETALKEVDKFFFDQRISLAVVTITGEEGEIDILARSDIRPWDFCAPRIFVKAPCSAFQPELEALEKKRSPHALHGRICG